jgi:hypothetical protein
MTTDSPFDLPIPDPWELFEQAIFLPPPEAELPPDPQAILLGDAERSIEGINLPELDVHADAISNLMDLAEASIESQQPTGKFFLPDEMLDKLEASIEQQEPKPTVIDEDPPTAEDGGVVPQGEMCRPPFLDGGVMSFGREYLARTPRMHGSRTSVRNDGGGSECYCYLHEGWVRAEDCRSCADFEQAETQKDEEEDCCRHSSRYQDGI